MSVQLRQIGLASVQFYRPERYTYHRGVSYSYSLVDRFKNSVEHRDTAKARGEKIRRRNVIARNDIFDDVCTDSHRCNIKS